MAVRCKREFLSAANSQLQRAPFFVLPLAGFGHKVPDTYENPKRRTTVAFFKGR
jgi:hypothetical protein